MRDKIIFISLAHSFDQRGRRRIPIDAKDRLLEITLMQRLLFIVRIESIGHRINGHIKDAE